MCITGISEEEIQKGTESLCKLVMAENFPNLVREMDTQIYESERQRILNPREKQLVTYEETPIIIQVDFSTDLKAN